MFAEYAANGSLLAYAGDLENADDFYPNLREAFTYEDEFYCAPEGLLDPRPGHQHRRPGRPPA